MIDNDKNNINTIMITILIITTARRPRILKTRSKEPLDKLAFSSTCAALQYSATAARRAAASAAKAAAGSAATSSRLAS
jgi:hypothetical protein